ncbi:hypothetical protein LPJ57_007941, partial [Coemansia sp. RSA 486]
AHAKSCVKNNSYSIDGIPSFIQGTPGTAAGAKTKHRLVAAADVLLPWVGGAAVGAAVALAAVRNLLK